jgi:hypothetical protein
MPGAGGAVWEAVLDMEREVERGVLVDELGVDFGAAEEEVEAGESELLRSSQKVLPTVS